MKRLTLIALLLLSAFSISRAQHFTTVWNGTPGYDHMNCYISGATIGSSELEAGDEIGIFDGSDCVGANVLTGPVTIVMILASADDPTTGDKDGFAEGASMSFRIWDNSAGIEYPATATFIGGDAVFTGSGSSNHTLHATLIEPEIDVSPSSSVNFGNVEVGSYLDETITICNTGSADLIITSTPISGAGFSIQSGGGAGTIPPGSCVDIIVRYTPASAGASSGSLTLNNNDSDEGTYVLSLSGTGTEPDIAVSPPSAAFGNVSVGATSDITITVTNEGSANLNISSTPISGADAALYSLPSGGGASTITPGSTHDIVVRFSPNAMGAFSAALSIYSNDPDENPVVVPLSGTGVQIDGHMTPGSYDYGDINVGSGSSTSFIVHNDGNVALEISSVALSGADAAEFSITGGGGSTTVGVGSTHTIDVDFVPSSPGAKSATLAVNSNDPSSPYTASLSGSGIAPEIEVSPASTVAFGNVEVGSYSDETVTISNVGTANLSITSTPISGTGFSIQSGGGAATIVAGSSADIVVRYTPASVGASSGSLTINNDDSDEGTYILSLSGTGTEPDIAVSPTAAAFGDVSVGSTSDITITVTNEGSADLTISSTPITGADAARYSLPSGGGAATINPASTHEITVRFSPNAMGATSATLTINSNDPDESPLGISLSGTGVQIDGDLSPASFDYGDVRTGSSSSTNFTLTNNGNVNLTISSVTASGDFAVTSSGSSPVAPGANTTIQVEFSPTSVGAKSGTLSVVCNDPDSPLTASLTGTGVEPDISASPNPLVFGEVAVGTTESQTLTIHNDGTADLDLGSFTMYNTFGEWTNNSFSLADIPPGGTRDVQINFTPSTTGVKTAYAVIYSDDPDEPEYHVTFDATGVIQDIGVSPTSLSFGDVNVGSSSSLTTTITNEGTYDLSITGKSITGTNASLFSITGGGSNTTLAPGATQVVTVEFSPDAMGAATATLSISSDDPDENPVDVSLSGSGVLIDGSLTPASNDYGDILVGSSSSASFTVSNDGNVSLDISSVALSGADAAEFSIASGGGSTTVTVGSTHTIDVDFAPTSAGAKSATLTVNSNDPSSPYTAALSGNGIAPEIDVSPASAVAFGNVLVGSYSDETVTVSNVGTADLSITSTAVSGTGFSIQSGGGAATITAGNSVDIVVRYTPASTGASSGSLTINNSDSDEDPYVLSLSGTGVIQDIGVSPASLPFGNVDVGNSSSLTTTISNEGSADLSITGKSLTGADASLFSITGGGANITLAPGATQIVTVEFSPDAAGAASATLVINSDDPDEDPVNVPLSGTGVVPDIDVSPNPLNFGDVVLGSSSDEGLTINNTGAGTLNMSAYTITGADAASWGIVTPCGSGELAPGGSCTMTLRYTPSSLGSETANLEISSNDPDEGTVTVVLNGTGVEPEIHSDITTADFGNVDVNSTADITITLSNVGTSDLHITDKIISGPDADRFSIQSGGGATTLAPGATQAVVVRFGPTAIGAVTASLDIASDDPDHDPYYGIALMGTGQAPDITASPNPASVGNVLVGDNDNVTITIDNEGNADLNISSTSIIGADASLFGLTSGGGSQTIAAGSSHDMIVQFTPDSRGAKSAALRIASNDPDEDPYDVALNGTGIAPQISVSPSSWNAGSVDVGSSSNRNFVVSNTGDATLNVSSAGIEAGGDTEFSVSSGGGAFTLSPSTSRTINVVFAPLAAGSYSANLQILSDAINDTDVDVPLSGSGADNDPPVVSVPDQTVAEGSSFATINLDDCVTDDYTADANIYWEYWGNTELGVSIVDRLCTITIPDLNWNGAETISFRAWDDDPTPLSGTDVATFTVTKVNDAPVMGDIPDQTKPDGVPFDPINLYNWVHDIETPDELLTFEFYNESTGLAPEFFDISIVNGIVTIVPKSSTWEGSETIRFIAWDDDLTEPLNASDLVTFTVNATIDPPVVDDIPDQTVDEGDSFATIDLDDYVTDSETSDANITWTAGGNSELTVTIVNRVATITIPDADWNGSETITFTATDDDPVATSSDSDAAIFTVNPVNDIPVITGQNSLSVEEDGSLTISLSQLTVTDVDNVPGDLSVHVQAGTNYTVAGSNTIEPDLNFNGSLSVNLVVNDGSDDSDPFAAAVTVTPVNDAPVVSGIADQTVEVGTSFASITLDDYVEDVETADENIIWSFAGNSELLVVITDRVAAISAPSAEWIGSETISFIATDDDASDPLDASDEAVFEVTCTNSAPVVDDIPDQTINIGGTFAPITLNDFVTDAETADEDITWAVSGNTNLTISIADGVATIAVDDDEWIGSETVTFTATDNAVCAESASDDVVLTVIDPEGFDMKLESVKVNVFPNPTQGDVFIGFSEQINHSIEVRVTNALGETLSIYNYEYVNTVVELDLDDFSRGVYYVTIISNDESVGFPVILE